MELTSFPQLPVLLPLYVHLPLGGDGSGCIISIIKCTYMYVSVL